MITTARCRRGFLMLCCAAAVLAVPAALHAPALGKSTGGDPPPPDAWLAWDDGSTIYLSNGPESGVLVSERKVYNGNCTWSADGREIAFYRDDPVHGWGIYATAADGGGGIRPITPLMHVWATYYRPDWSKSVTPTGTEMILFSDIPPGEGNTQIYAVRPDGTGKIRLTFDELYWSNPVWSPDGSRFAADGQGEVRICDVGLVGGQLAILAQRPITGIPGGLPSGHGQDWSHGGGWIVLLSEGYIHRVNVNDPTDIVQLFGPAPYNMDPPHFTPDDSKIVFGMFVRPSRALYTIDTYDGSNLTPLGPKKQSYARLAVKH
ncbi:MAG: PD40 domain-containing protein [Kiritimatiellae bacterium]|nr:PD40 domain-containing protein [Kiritimatiellia bacterium]